MMKTVLIALLALVAVALGTDCESNSDCATSEYCQQCFLPSPLANKCAPRLARGQSCSGFVMCPSQCDLTLTCQARWTPPGEPEIADAPGVCCSPIACPQCATNAAVNVSIDPSGCIVSCGCRAEPTPECGANSQYSECGSACPPTCTNPSPMCAAVCVPSCTCNQGYVLHNGKCILPSECPSTTPPPTTTAPPTQQPGEPTAIDPTDAGVLTAATCVAEYLSNMRNAPLSLVQVVSGTQQVVSGMSYMLQLQLTCPDCALFTYSANIWIRPWLTPSCNVESVMLVATLDHPATAAAVSEAISVTRAAEQVTTNPPTTTPTTTTPEAISTMGGLVGGQQQGDVGAEDVRAAAACALAAQNAQSNSLFALQLVGIARVSKQVVAGIRYSMVLQAGYSTTCRNDGTVRTLDACPVAATAVTTYNAVVVVQAWMTPSCSLVSFTAAPTETITTTAPSPTPSPTTTTTTPTTTAGPETTTPSINGQELVGEAGAVDVSSTYVQHAAVCAVTDMNARSNNAYQTQLVRVLTATRQVVSGIKYDITFLAAVSTQCLNDGTAPDLLNCPVGDNAALEYQATVVVQAWQPMSCIVSRHAVLTSAVTSDAASGSSSSSGSSNSNGVIVGVLVGVVALLSVVAVVLIVRIRRQSTRGIARAPLINMAADQ